MTKMSTCLWFDGQAEEAARFYVSVFRTSKILATSHYPEGVPVPMKAGSVMTVQAPSGTSWRGRGGRI